MIRTLVLGLVFIGSTLSLADGPEINLSGQ